MSLPVFLRENARFLSVGGLLSFSSSYGQTFFIAIFAAQIMGAYSLSDGEWGGIYTLSTTASAIVMFWAGGLVDRFRIRNLAFVVMPSMALVCVLMAVNTTIAGLVVIVFLLRLFGQGMMSQLAVVAMARWFAARRGLALSISALGLALGTAAFPIIIASLLGAIPWRWVWVISAALLMLTCPLILRLLSEERTPQSLVEASDTTGMAGRHWTKSEVLRSRIFWLLFPMLLGPPAWGTAFFFQQVHIAEVKGWPLLDFLALIPVLAIISVLSTIISGQAIDRFGSARLATVYLLPIALAYFILGLAETLSIAAVGIVFLGIGHGIQATLPTAFWAEFFGTRHIGAIKAVSASIMVFGSAIGPGVSGALIDLGWTFAEQMIGISVYFVAASILVLVAVRDARAHLPSGQVGTSDA
ncbi:MAG: MFS transporter [Pseudomonadota bacterium]